MVYYTSDHHFGHTNIIKYCNRPYQTVEEMDEDLLNKWNEVVKPNDIVWHLGDVYFKNHEPINKVIGKITLILGNHDYKHKGFLAINGWKVKYEGIIIDHENKLVLSHYPLKDWPQKYQGYIHLHGHSHGTVEGYDKDAIDVGVDCWDGYPITINQIMAKRALRYI